MPVFCRPLAWPNSTIPYEIAQQGAANQRGLLAGAVQEINRSIRYHILVDKRANEPDYLSLHWARGASDAIGHRQGSTDINGETTPMAIHEVMHALGFLHEQYHRYYPWDDTDPGSPPPVADFKANPGLFAYDGPNRPLQNPWNRALHAAANQQFGDFFGGDFQLFKRHAAVGDGRIMHYLACDLDSVMMYPKMRDAYRTASGNAVPPGALLPIHSGIPAPGNGLSNFDISALQALYPDPGLRCVKCHDVHGRLPSVINRWHRCTSCSAVYCPTCGGHLAGKLSTLDPTRQCDRAGCAGRTQMAYG
jgi:hypothetical protein